MRPEILGLETFNDDFAAFQIHPDPVTAESFTHVIRRPAAAKRVKDHITFTGRHLDDAFQDLCGQLVQRPFPAFELPVTDGCNIIPDICQIYPFRVHRPSVTSVILDLSTAVTACLDGRADFPEGICLPLGEIQKTIMGRIQPSGNRQRQFDIDRNPVTKRHPGFCQITSQMDIPFRKIVNEQRPARFQDPYAVIQPISAPGKIVVIRTTIIDLDSVFFGQIERRIGKDGIDGIVINTRQRYSDNRLHIRHRSDWKNEVLFYSGFTISVGVQNSIFSSSGKDMASQPPSDGFFHLKEACLKYRPKHPSRQGRTETSSAIQTLMRGWRVSGGVKT